MFNFTEVVNKSEEDIIAEPAVDKAEVSHHDAVANNPKDTITINKRQIDRCTDCNWNANQQTADYEKVLH